MLRLTTQACSETSYTKYFTSIVGRIKTASEHFAFLNFCKFYFSIPSYIFALTPLKVSSMCELFIVMIVK